MKFFIEIEELKVDTIIGVFEEERLKPQTILISIKCQLEIDHNQDLDNIENVTSYSDIKNEIIKWSWEILTNEYKISPDDLYVTIFEGSSEDGLQKDNEAEKYWSEIIDESRIILGNKKDNFWEMGDTGPCGPCSEIHVDLRTEEEKLKLKCCRFSK